MEFCLEEIRPGERAMITHIPEGHPLKGRLREFGFVPETVVNCPFVSPRGDLAALEMGGSVIAVRINDLTGIRARRC